MRPVYVLPNLFTSASLFSALCSIVATGQGNYVLACYLILLSAILDGMDGPVARWTRTTSSFGLQYDSLADVVAFGVAPAFLMYNKLDSIDQAVQLPVWAPRMAIGGCALFAICGAIRLARFNIQVADVEKLHFTGLPIPAAAGTVVSTFLVIETYKEFLPDSRYLHRTLLILMLLLSYLMVSTYPFPSLKSMHRRMRRSWNGLVTAVFVICILLAFRAHLPLIAFVGFLSYLAASMWGVVRKKRRLGKAAVPAPGGPVPQP
ncbi:CDP-diacylglycerol--serine O-phosphatidyltransferase [Candidatus Poribacteria bacterium]|nr:CDP-diacylglycerol--serine O-phosphatidyltransferase [Candidatus Poribacteria bacterium]